MLSRNSLIIKGLASGKSFTQVAEELDVCRQTVSKVYHRYIIFGPDGIRTDALRLGRKPTINREKAKELLCLPLYAIPPNNNHWTLHDLSDECDLPTSTIYNLMKLKGVSLEDKKTIHKAIDVSDLDILEIDGFFISPGVSVIVFSCHAKSGMAQAIGVRKSTFYNMGNVQVFFSRTIERFLSVVDVLFNENLSWKPKSIYHEDFLLFLKLIDESIEQGRQLLLITTNLEMVMGERIVFWLDRHTRFQIIDLLGFDQWVERVRYRLETVSEWNRKKIAVQFENLVIDITDYIESPRKNQGVFASIFPLRRGIS